MGHNDKVREKLCQIPSLSNGVDVDNERIIYVVDEYGTNECSDYHESREKKFARAPESNKKIQFF